MKFTATMADTAIEAGIAAIARRAGTLTNDVQMVGVSILAAFKASGDKPTAVKRANALVAALGKGLRANSLLAWFETYAPLSYNKDTKQLVAAVTAASAVKTHDAIDVAKAMKAPWSEAMPEVEYKPIADAKAAVLSLVKRMETDIEKMGDKSAVDAKLLQGLKLLAA